MSKQRAEVPGDVLATQAAIQRASLRMTGALHKLDHVVVTDDDRDPWLVKLAFKAPEEDFGDWLAIVTGETATGRVVAFHRADTFAEAVVGVANRYVNKSLKWREDRYENG